MNVIAPIKKLKSWILNIPDQSVYDLGTEVNSSSGGTYNCYLLFLLGLGVLSLFAPVKAWLVIFLTANLLVAILLDPTTWKTKISINSLPLQLLYYFRLVRRTFWELGKVYFLAFLFFLIVEPFWHRSLKEMLPWLALSSFWLLYGFYFVFRLYLLFKYAFIVLFCWDTYHKSPFLIKSHNLATPSKALRHVFWSFFLGNVGLTVRCCSQVVILFIFTAIQSMLPLDKLYSMLSPDQYQFYLGGAVLLFFPWKMLTNRADGIAAHNYYIIHRTLHQYKVLYDPIHRLHHSALKDDKRNIDLVSCHHQLHHRYPKYNFCLFGFFDKKYGTKFLSFPSG